MDTGTITDKANYRFVNGSGDTVKFTFDGTKYANCFTKNNKISIRANSSVSIRIQRDADGNYAGYTPSNDDCHPDSICTVSIKILHQSLIFAQPAEKGINEKLGVK
ncbi:hypothetical protein [Clostridium thailandense]|uniref:hypothetical protein n=1 Tax=Clostridium thailandense TaxID=2794346 RepID=UPI00398A42F2